MRRDAAQHPRMPDFEHTTLWRISSFDEMRERDGESPTLLPTTLLSDLNQLHRDLPAPPRGGAAVPGRRRLRLARHAVPGAVAVPLAEGSRGFRGL
jgi:hypothetical protein